MEEIIEFLLHGESIRTKAYLDSGGVPTIGIGSTYYKDGRPVKIGDKITTKEAFELANFVAMDMCFHVKKCLTREVSKNKFTALVSFCYNIGKGAFAKSIILKMVNANPNDPAIKDMFPKSFITAKGKKCDGLVNRRLSEANKYFQ